MYAVIRTGGKQYRVEEGDTIQIEKIAGEKGDEILFDEVLFIGGDEYRMGTPIVAGAAVTGRVVRQMRGKKIVVFKMKRRKGFHKKQGHRQNLTEISITRIATDKEV